MELIIPAMFRLFERWLIVIEAMIIVYLGYKLFVLGVKTTQTELDIKSKFVQLVVRGTAPGLFFMVLGSIILLACLYTGQTKLDYYLSRIKASSPDIKNVSPEVMKDEEYQEVRKVEIQISHLKWLLLVSHLLLYCAITVSFALLFIITYTKQRKMLSGLSERLKANEKAITNINKTNIKKIIDSRIPISEIPKPTKKDTVVALRTAEAEERLKAEAQARAEAEKADVEARIEVEKEAKAEQMIAKVKAEAAETIANQREMSQAEAEEKAKAYGEAIARAEGRLKAETEAITRTEAEEKAKAYADAIAEAEEKTRSHFTEIARIDRQVKHYTDALAEAKKKLQAEERAKDGPGPIKILEIPAQTATCECCGRKNIPKNQLVKIDSGQRFCPDCLKALESPR